MAARVSGLFGAETQIICLWHEGSMTWVQCQLGFVGDPCSYQDTFREVLQLTVFS